ncbi:hypothetical protein ABIF07_005446 [Bradyrhizobium elkanii]|nr:hypothetical protein [Bradyrhizobium elkanii]
MAAAETLRTLAEGRPQRAESVIQSQFLFRLCLSAICHQINWDFLSARLSDAFSADQTDAKALREVSARDVQQWLNGYARPERIRASERAALVRDIGNVLVESYEGSADRLLGESRGLLNGATGLLSRLDAFVAFREDPLRKKSNVLVHDIVRDGVARFEDENEILPAIDYHIMRLYLRTGRVAPLHRSTMDLFKGDSAPRPRLVKLLREAVSRALTLTALYSKLSVPAVNGLEWEIGRSICERGRPRCLGPVDETTPAHLMQTGQCPNVGFCRAFADAEWKELREPDSNKRFY